MGKRQRHADIALVKRSALQINYLVTIVSGTVLCGVAKHWSLYSVAFSATGSPELLTYLQTS
jgi:hypothetical protein